MPILAAVGSASDWIGAWVVPEKGAHWYAIKALVGCIIIQDTKQEVILKSDQEPAAMKLRAAVKREITVKSSVRRIASGRVKVAGKHQCAASMCTSKINRGRT